MGVRLDELMSRQMQAEEHFKQNGQLSDKLVILTKDMKGMEKKINDDRALFEATLQKNLRDWKRELETSLKNRSVESEKMEKKV